MAMLSCRVSQIGPRRVAASIGVDRVYELASVSLYFSIGTPTELPHSVQLPS